MKSALAALLLIPAANAFAIDFVQTNQFVVAETNALTEETWVSAQTVRMTGSASNDFFAAAQAMELLGLFHGDVWSIGDSIHAAGIFQRSTRLISRIAQIQGTHHGAVMAVGNTVKVDRQAVVYGDLFCLGENVIIEGSVDGNTRILAQRITLGGEISGDISIVARDIVVLPNTILNGNVTYQAAEELVLPASVVLDGGLTRTFPVVEHRWFKENLEGHFMFALAALLTGFVFTALFPRYTGAAVQNLRTANGLCALSGFAALVIMPMAAMIMLFTVIGMPLSILLLLFYGILLYLSKVIVALWIGSLILKRNSFHKKQVAAPMALGLLILYASTSLEAVGMMVNIAIIIFGLGALSVALFKRPGPVINTDGLPQPPKEGETS